MKRAVHRKNYFGTSKMILAQFKGINSTFMENIKTGSTLFLFFALFKI